MGKKELTLKWVGHNVWRGASPTFFLVGVGEGLISTNALGETGFGILIK